MSETEPISPEKKSGTNTKITFAEYLAYRAAREGILRKTPDEPSSIESIQDSKEKNMIKKYGGAAYVRAQETGTDIDDLVDIGDRADAIE